MQILYCNDPHNEFKLKETKTHIKNFPPFSQKTLLTQELGEKILIQKKHITLLENQKDHTKAGKAGRAKKSSLTGRITSYTTEIDKLEKLKKISNHKITFSLDEDTLCPVLDRSYYIQENLVETLWYSEKDEMNSVKEFKKEVDECLADHPNISCSEALKKLYQPDPSEILN